MADCPCSIDEFCAWVGDALSLPEIPDPSAPIDELTKRDDVARLALTSAFDCRFPEVVSRDNEIYDLDTVRDMYLYYLIKSAMPPDLQ